MKAIYECKIQNILCLICFNNPTGISQQKHETEAEKRRFYIKFNTHGTNFHQTFICIYVYLLVMAYTVPFLLHSLPYVRHFESNTTFIQVKGKIYRQWEKV